MRNDENCICSERNMPKESREGIIRLYEQLLSSARYSQTEEDRKLIHKAFCWALEAHKNVNRKSGEPYILHPLEVALIVAQMGLDTESIVCALLHDVVEDTEYELEDVKERFSEKTAEIIDGLTKIRKVFSDGKGNGKEDRAEIPQQIMDFQKLLLFMTKDIRVILIKIADRLHNMRTMSIMPQKKQMKKANEVLTIYAPLAHRLGLYPMKRELENLGFRYYYPKQYAEMIKKIRETQQQRLELYNKLATPIRQSLEDTDIQFVMKFKTKSAYSAWQKMNLKNISFEELYNFFAIRIIFKENEKISEREQCYRIMARIADIYPMRAEKLRDWIDHPRDNGYEAVHTAVICPGYGPVEVQILSQRMHEIAEKGYIMHLNNEDAEHTELSEWIEMVEAQLKTSLHNPEELVNDFLFNLYSSDIQVYSKDNEIFNLPKNGTVLDFAFHIHTELGKHCKSGTVNGRLVGPSHILQEGDKVKINTDETVKPAREWLKIVKSSRSITALNRYFSHQRAKSILEGSYILKTYIRDLLPKGMKNLEEREQKEKELLDKLIHQFKCKNKEELFLDVFFKKIILDDVKRELSPSRGNFFQRVFNWRARLQPSKDSSGMPDNTFTTDDVTYIIASCCSPVPGDNVLGLIDLTSEDKEIEVHKNSCEHLPHRGIGWKVVPMTLMTEEMRQFPAQIELTGYDQMGLVHEVTKIISRDLNVNMRSIQMTAKDSTFTGKIKLYVSDLKTLNKLISKLKTTKGIETVQRSSTDKDN